jgi:hypothetical protein
VTMTWRNEFSKKKVLVHLSIESNDYTILSRLFLTLYRGKT